MSCISWNCGGLENPCAVRDLCLLVKEKRPKFLFLIKTKMRQFKLQNLRIKMGFEGMFATDPVGKRGGLDLFWTDFREVSISNFSLQ
jgi:hypothetical protein